MLYYGHGGKLEGIVSSTAGVRQGSPLATLYFCAFLQPILETLSMEFPTIEISAFIDDITLVSTDPDQLEKAFIRLQALMSERQLNFSLQKCVWFEDKHDMRYPPNYHRSVLQRRQLLRRS